MDDETLLRGGRTPSSIADLLGKSTGEADHDDEAAALDKLTPLPGPGDPYKALPRAANKMLPTVHFLIDSAREGFSYADLRRLRMIDGDDPEKRPVILLYFAAMVPTEVRIEGNHLDAIYNLLGQHRLGWVRQWPTGRGFSDPNAAVVTKIGIKLLDGFPQE